MSVALARAHHALWVFFLAGLVLLASSQHALRDPRSQAVARFYSTDLCAPLKGASNTPSPAHTHPPHCPLCVMGGFSDGVPPFVALPQPVQQTGERLRPLEAARPSIKPVFPRLNRGPP